MANIHFGKEQQQQQQTPQGIPFGRQMVSSRMIQIGSTWLDCGELPILDPKDLYQTGQQRTDPASSENFQTACRDGSLSTVQAIVSSAARSPIFLHLGLCHAISAGKIEIVRYLVAAGAPITKRTPEFTIREAPLEQQLPLLEIFSQHGWDPRSPEGTLLLPRVVTRLPILRWLLDHGADPNLAATIVYRDMSGPEKNSCAALEAAAGGGHVEAVRILLDAGAEIRHGIPLHYAAAACPPGENPDGALVRPSKEFDESRIPVMALLVERGADVNQKEETQYMTARYAIVSAVMAGAVERVKWLLERGADPELQGPRYGSAVSFANIMGSEEMKKVVAEGARARRRAENLISSDDTKIILKQVPENNSAIE